MPDIKQRSDFRGDKQMLLPDPGQDDGLVASRCCPTAQAFDNPRALVGVEAASELQPVCFQEIGEAVEAIQSGCLVQIRSQPESDGEAPFAEFTEATFFSQAFFQGSVFDCSSRIRSQQSCHYHASLRYGERFVELFFVVEIFRQLLI